MLDGSTMRESTNLLRKFLTRFSWFGKMFFRMAKKIMNHLIWPSKCKKTLTNSSMIFSLNTTKKLTELHTYNNSSQKNLRKKGSTLPAQLRNRTKQQKMDIEPIKEQEKKVIEPQAVISKKKQSLNSKKPSVSRLVEPTPTLVQELKKQTSKKSNEVQTKMNQTKKQVTDVHLQTKPDTQERKKQIVKQIQTIELKKQISVLNKQTKTQEKTQDKNDKSEPALEIQQPLKPQKQNFIENPLLNQTEVKIPPQLPKAEISDPIENQQSQQNQIPPISVILNKSPSEEQINEITNMMNLLFQIQQFETLSKVVRILTKFEKQTMMIDGQDVNFRMNEIHISTFNKIKKELQMKFYQLETSQKIKGLNSLMTKHKVRSFLSEVNSNGNEGEMIEQQEQKPNEINGFVNQEHEQMIALEQ